MKIGFVGLGAMGGAMATRLVNAGHEVWVWNRSLGSVEALRSQGAHVARTPADAAQSEVLFSMLANDQAVREVVFEGGLLEALEAGAVHVNLATISLTLATELARAHAKRGVAYIAAPVFGRPDVAAAGKLNIAVAGEQAAIEKVRPLLELLAARIWPMGTQPASANAVKLAGNFMLATAVETMAEAGALVQAHGVAPADFLAMLTSTIFSAPVYQTYGKLIAERQFEPPGFALALGYKDVALALAAGEAGQVALPLASVVRDRLLQAMARGDGNKDLAALALAFPSGKAGSAR